LNLDGITKGCQGNDFDLLTFQQSHFQQPLQESALSLDRLNAAALTDLQLVESGHAVRLRDQRSNADGNGTDVNVHGIVGAQTQAATAQFEQARAARLKYPQQTTGPEAQFREPTEQTRFARDLGDLAPFSGMKTVERH
jgi:hypothetical protein